MNEVVSILNVSVLRSSTGGSAVPVIWLEGYTNQADGGEGMFIFVPSDTSSADNGGTILVDNAGNRYYRDGHKNAFNICWFGASAGTAADTAPILAAALAALPPGGGQIYFPPGKFQFNSTVVYNIPAGTFSVSFQGAGADATILYWPNGSGINVNASSANHSAHFADLSFTTAAAGTGNAVAITNSVLLGEFAQTDFTRVTFRGDYSGAQTYYWAIGVAINGISNVAYDTLLFYGYNGNGIGIYLAGNTAVQPYYSIVHNIAKCGFFGLGIGLCYGAYIQGVTVSQCNFTNGVTGIYIPPGISGPTQLTVLGSEFNTTANQINFESPIAGVFITGNYFFVPNGASGIYINATGDQACFQGNVFTGATTNASIGICVPAAFTEAVVTGNAFNNLATGVDLGAAKNWNVQANVYGGTTKKVVHGSGNSVGVATD